MRKRSTFGERPMTTECEHPQRYPGEPTGYIALHEWAEEKAKTHEQRFCPHCKRWAIWEPLSEGEKP